MSGYRTSDLSLSCLQKHQMIHADLTFGDHAQNTWYMNLTADRQFGILPWTNSLKSCESCTLASFCDGCYLPLVLLVGRCSTFWQLLDVVRAGYQLHVQMPAVTALLSSPAMKVLGSGCQAGVNHELNRLAVGGTGLSAQPARTRSCGLRSCLQVAGPPQ